MKIELSESLDFIDFEEAEEEFKEFYYNLVNCFEEEMGVPLYGLEHEYKLFRLFCVVNGKFYKKALEEWNNTMYYIIDAYKKDKKAFKEMIRKAIKNRDEALIFFWEYREDAENYANIRNEKYIFNKKSRALFDLFPKLIEDIIKREAYLLNEVNIIMGYYRRDDNKNKLYNIIDNLLDTPTYDLKFHVMNNLSGISVNQYRNIVAHSSFKTENNKIYATYGYGKQVVLSIDELESLLFEIYKLRTFTKICINFSIDFMLAKYPELRSDLKIIPETAIIDTNASLEKVGIKILSSEISDYFEFDGKKIEEDNQTFFILDIESKGKSLIETIEILFLAITNFFPMFNEKNNYPDLSEILWILKIKVDDREEPFHLCISYDEIKILKSHPIGYAKMMSEKIKKQVDRNE